MGLKQTYGFKFRSDLKYMTPPERAMMKQLLEAQVLSVFKLGVCERCKSDVVKGKRFCSKKCCVEANNGDKADGQVD